MFYAKGFPSSLHCFVILSILFRITPETGILVNFTQSIFEMVAYVISIFIVVFMHELRKSFYQRSILYGKDRPKLLIIDYNLSDLNDRIGCAFTSRITYVIISNIPKGKVVKMWIIQK